MDILGNFSDIRGDTKARRVRRKEELNFEYGDTAIDRISTIEKKKDRTTLSWVKFAVVGIFCIMILRVFSLQIVQGEANKSLALGNSIRPRLIEAPRGQILDSSGGWLARNTSDFSLALYPSDLPKKKSDREEYYQKIAALVSMDQAEVKKNAEKNGLISLDMAIIKEDMPRDDALLLEEKIKTVPGLFIAKRYSREYSYTLGLGHVLGYTGAITENELKNGTGYYLSDHVGKTGIEKTAEQYLRGVPGVEQVEVDSKGNVNQILLDDNSTEPVAGNNVWLYMDRGLQNEAAKVAADALVKAKEDTGKDDIKTAVAIVMDVKTGGILAMVSTPDYDSNLFSGADSGTNYSKILLDKSMPMFDRSIAGTYPPGSSSKPMLAAAALQEGTINANTVFDAPGSITVGGSTFINFESKELGATTVRSALEFSNNIFFYAAGGGYGPIKGLGIDRIKKYWQLFGLGRPTGVDLLGEASGLLPDPTWKKKAQGENWYIGDTYHVSIGQGDLLVTPIQMLRMVNSIANGGKVVVPHIVKKVTDPEGNVIKEYGEEVVNANFISPQNLKTVQEGMRLVATGGSAMAMANLPVEVAGKTGSAQYDNNQRVHGWFVGYAPYDNPQIAVLTMVEGGGMSTATAVPMAKDLFNYYFTR
ncbi:MAG: penicillin-binding protein 2 [Candidatus Berkelbacteria bacterium]